MGKTWVVYEDNNKGKKINSKFVSNILFNSSPCGQEGQNFTDDIFRCILMNEKISNLVKISPQFVS